MKIFKLIIYLMLFSQTLLARDFNITEFTDAKTSVNLQKRVDTATLQVMNGVMGNLICQINLTAEDLENILGTSSEYSKIILKNCETKKNAHTISVNKQPRIWKRSILFINKSPTNLDILSWTDQQSQTFIFKSETELSDEELKEILTHELAILLDSKAAFYYTSYLILKEQLTNDKLTDTIYLNIDETNKETQKNIKLFSGITNSQISLTFATMRAFNIEIIDKNKQPQTMYNAENCIRAFEYWYTKIKNQQIAIPNIKLKNSESAVQDYYFSIATLTDLNSQTIDYTLDAIRNKNYLIYDPQIKKDISFCQFMARPLFTFNIRDSFLSNGPRPNPGGWHCVQGEESCPSTEPTSPTQPFATEPVAEPTPVSPADQIPTQN